MRASTLLGVAISAAICIFILASLFSQPFIGQVAGNLDPSVKIVANSSSRFSVSYNEFLFDLTNGRLDVSRSDGIDFNISYGSANYTVKEMTVNSPNHREVVIYCFGTKISIQDGYGFVIYNFGSSQIELNVNRPPDQVAFANLILADGSSDTFQIHPDISFVIS